MRTTLVAGLTFLAGLLLGATLFSEGGDSTPGMLEDGGGSGTSGNAPQAPKGPGTGPSTDETATGVDDSSPGGGASTAGPTLVAAGAPGGGSERQMRRAWALGLVDASYARYRQGKETAVPAEFRRAVATGAVAHAGKSLDHFGGWLRSYIDQHRALGALGDPPRLVLQARGSGNVSVSDWPVTLRKRARVSDETLDLRSIPEGPRDMDVYLETGVPPLDRALVIERIEFESRLADARSTLEVRVDGATALKRRGGGAGESAGSLQGLAVFTSPYDQVKISASLFRSSVGLAAHGRYVPIEDARKLKKQLFRPVQEGDDGLLGEEPVTLQILADHGGGNPRLVRLDGSTNSRVEGMSETDLWDETLDLRKLRRSSAWTENAGSVPPDKIYRITRIDWRARLDPNKSSHSDVVIRFKGKELVEHKAPDGLRPSDTWEGSIDVRPGEEKQLELECSYFGLGEAIVIGTLVDAAEATKK